MEAGVDNQTCCQPPLSRPLLPLLPLLLVLLLSLVQEVLQGLVLEPRQGLVAWELTVAAVVVP